MRTRFAAGTSALMAMLCVAMSGCASWELENAPLRELLGATPTSDRIALARIKEKQGDVAAAERIYRELREQSPTDPEPTHRLAVLLTRSGDLDQAERMFQEALGIGTPSVQLVSDYAYHAYLQGDAIRAEKFCRQALTREPEFQVAWTNLGLALGAQDRFDEAREAFQRAAVSPADAHCDLAFALASRGRWDVARQEYDRALILEPNHPVAAEGLLQVSKKLPGLGPMTVVRTVGVPLPVRESSEAFPPGPVGEVPWNGFGAPASPLAVPAVTGEYPTTSP